MPDAGGCDFPIDPKRKSNGTAIFWRPDLDPSSVLLTPAPALFAGAARLGAVKPAFERRAADGIYWLVNDPPRRTPVVLMTNETRLAPVAAVVPLDHNFEGRVHAARRLSRLLHGQRGTRPPGGLTKQQRDRHRLMLRALDANPPSETYRAIAQGLFGRESVPAGQAWETHDLRDKTIRLVKDGTALMQGGYLKLLRGSRWRSV